MKLYPFQMQALQELQAAISRATEVGLLDIAIHHCESMDSINDTCDAIANLAVVAEEVQA